MVSCPAIFPTLPCKAARSWRIVLGASFQACFQLYVPLTLLLLETGNLNFQKWRWLFWSCTRPANHLGVLACQESPTGLTGGLVDKPSGFWVETSQPQPVDYPWCCHRTLKSLKLDGNRGSHGSCYLTHSHYFWDPLLFSYLAYVECYSWLLTTWNTWCAAHRVKSIATLQVCQQNAPIAIAAWELGNPLCPRLQ